MGDLAGREPRADGGSESSLRPICAGEDFRTRSSATCSETNRLYGVLDQAAAQRAYPVRQRLHDRGHRDLSMGRSVEKAATEPGRFPNVRRWFEAIRHGLRPNAPTRSPHSTARRSRFARKAARSCSARPRPSSRRGRGVFSLTPTINPSASQLLSMPAARRGTSSGSSGHSGDRGAAREVAAGEHRIECCRTPRSRASDSACCSSWRHNSQGSRGSSELPDRARGFLGQCLEHRCGIRAATTRRRSDG